MIQRIQSVYLLVAGILSVITLFTPLAYLTLIGKEAYLTLNSTNVQSIGLSITGLPTVWPLALFSAVAAVLAFVAIFQYKNRKQQLKYVRSVSLCLVLFYVFYTLYCYQMLSGAEFSFSPTLFAGFPLLAFFLTLLAHRAIRKDDKMVRAADRLR